MRFRTWRLKERLREREARLEQSAPPKKLPPRFDDCAVLVANSSHTMAQAITAQLTVALPGCAITYAPTLELTRWILKRRRIDLLVASPLLPDGRIGSLESLLQKLAHPPDVVIVGDVPDEAATQFKRLGYRCSSVVRANRKRPPAREKITALGADLRNDLNNPLQEIVAMIFVAQAGDALSPAAQQALQAINHAAQNMAGVVAGLEGKIRGAVG